MEGKRAVNKREEFEKALEAYAEACLFDGEDSGEGEYAVCGPTEPLRLEVLRLFDAYGAQCRAAGQWIACSERLPEPGQYCLLYRQFPDFKDMDVNRRRSFEWEYNDPDTTKYTTHWMPLPAPPSAAARPEEGE